MLKALYFPASKPQSARAGGWLNLLDRLICYGVVEEERPAADCEVRVVLPLGEERQRFLALVKEMTGRDAEYFKGQMAVMASRQGADGDESSGWRLSSALRKSEIPDAEKAEALRRERFWKARLIMKLAETIAESEAEIKEQLREVARKQAALFKNLHGETEEDDSPELPQPLAGFSSGRQQIRIRDLLAAWSVMFGEDQLAEPFMVTDDPEAGELLLEELEKMAPGSAVRLPDLVLPGEDDVSGRPFAEERAALLKALEAIVSGDTSSGRYALPEAAKAWTGKVSALSKEARPAKLFMVPAAAMRQVLAGLSGIDRTGEEQDASPVMLLGVIFTGKD